MSTQGDVDLTPTQCSKCGNAPQELEVMVMCTNCSRWFDYACAGVSETILRKKKRWFCDDVTCAAAAKKRSKKGGNPPLSADESDTGSVQSASDKQALSAEEQLKAVDEDHRRAEAEMEVEMQIKKKQLELQVALKRKKLQEQRELRERQRKLEMELEDEARELEFEEKNRELRHKLKARQDHLKRMQELKDSFKGQLSIVDQELAALKSGVKVDDKPKDASDQMPHANDDDDEESGSSDEESDKEPEETTSKTKTTPAKVSKTAAVPNGLERKRSGPTKAQLAARHGINKHLQPFSGKPEDWPLFYAAYISSTEACGYSDVDNLARLQQCLKGNALELVRGQLLLPKSVPRVIEKLRQHFGRPEQLLQSFLDRVQKLEQPKNLRDFIPFSNVVEQLCEHLEAAKMKQHLKNPLLITNLVKKLPDIEKRQWVEVKRKQGQNRITLRTLTDFLARIAEDACETGVDMDFAVESKVPDNQSSTYKEQRALASTNTSDSDAKMLKLCKACQRTGHGLRFCQNFKDMPYADRAQIVFRERLCEICLNGHGGVCRMKIRCNVGECREAHNPLMHPVEVDATGLSAHIRTGDEMLFRIVPVQLHCGERTVTVLAFLDEGSSVTVIDSKLADRLGLDGVEEKLTIKWTGSISRVESRSRRMNVWVSAVGSGDKMLLNKVRTVGQLLLPRQMLHAEEIAAQCQHLRGLPIQSYDGQPELLIGLNNLHTFAPMESRVGRSMTEPIAVRCRFGWTVYGPRRLDTTGSNSYLGYHHEQLQSGNYPLEGIVDVEEESTASSDVFAIAALNEAAAAKRRVAGAVEKRSKATPAAIDVIKEHPTQREVSSQQQKVKLLKRVQPSTEKQPAKPVATARRDPLEKVSKRIKKRQLQRNSSHREVERADSAASAGSFSSGLEPAKLSADEKVQLLDGEAKLIRGHGTMEGDSRTVGGIHRRGCCWTVNPEIPIERQMLRAGVLPRPNGQFEPLEYHPPGDGVTPQVIGDVHASSDCSRAAATIAPPTRIKTNEKNQIATDTEAIAIAP